MKEAKEETRSRLGRQLRIKNCSKCSRNYALKITEERCIKELDNRQLPPRHCNAMRTQVSESKPISGPAVRPWHLADHPRSVAGSILYRHDDQSALKAMLAEHLPPQ